MPTETTYTALREKLASYLDMVTDDNEVVVVRRRGGRDVAIIPADELAGLMETAHLLRSPKNAERLLGALEESKKLDGKKGAGKPGKVAIQELRASMHLDQPLAKRA